MRAWMKTNLVVEAKNKTNMGLLDEQSCVCMRQVSVTKAAFILWFILNAPPCLKCSTRNGCTKLIHFLSGMSDSSHTANKSSTKSRRTSDDLLEICTGVETCTFLYKSFSLFWSFVLDLMWFFWAQSTIWLLSWFIELTALPFTYCSS